MRVKDVPLEVQLLSEGLKLLTRGESADPQAGLTVRRTAPAGRIHGAATQQGSERR